MPPNSFLASQPEVGRIHKYIALAYAAKIKLRTVRISKMRLRTP